MSSGYDQRRRSAGLPLGFVVRLHYPKGAAMKALRLVGFAVCLGVGTLLVASGQGPAAAQGDKKASQQWEYQSVSGENVGRFNVLGAEGWELCAATSGSQTKSESFIFKRPKGSKPQAGGERAESKIEGTWEHTFPDEPGHLQVKILNRTHFVWVTYNREDGKPLRLGGGTYTLDGKTYKENFEFGGPGLPAELVGKEQTFTAEVEEGKWTLSGTLSNGFEVTEVWRKVK
jgi:hypothetical protein